MTNNPQRPTFNSVLTILADAFSKEGREGGERAASTLRQAISQPYRPCLSTSDPGPVLDHACHLPDALPFSRYILACRSLLDWTSWEGEGLTQEISSKLYTTELVGPDGHIEASDVRVGLLVSDADTDYPISSHSGEETYLVIAGHAEWKVASEPYTIKTPGKLIHHPAWVPHGRRTKAQPFLGAWRWSGDLDLSTFSVQLERGITKQRNER